MRLRETARARAEAMAKVIEQALPQLATSHDVMDPNAEEPAMTDEWKLSNTPPDCLIALAALDIIAQSEKAPWLHDFVQTMLRGFPGLNGNRATMIAEVIMALGGGGRGRAMRRRGWVGRHITHRGEPEYEEEEE